MANSIEPPNPNPPIPELDAPPLDMDFLNSDLGFMDDLDFDFDISFDDLTFPHDGSDVLCSSAPHDSPDGGSNSPYLEPGKVDRRLNDVSRVLNSPSPSSESGDGITDPKTSGSGNSQDSDGCSSVVGGFINSPSPESGVMSGSTSPASDCNVRSVIVDVVDQELKVEEEAKVLKRKKEEENSSNPNSNPRKFRKSVPATGSPVDGLAPEEDKKKARLMRNRESAQLSRQRKKHYVEELEDKVRSLHTVIADLNNRISYIMAENVNLRQQLSGGNVPPPQPGVYPPPGMAPMAYPWIPYPMNPQGSQVPLVPIPRLKPRQPTSASKPKKSDVKKTDSKTKKVSSVTFLGLLFFLFLFGGLVPLVNVRFGDKMQNGHSGFGYSSGGFHGHPQERILTVNNHLNMSHSSEEEGYHGVASDLRECGANRVNCRRIWVEGTESNVKQGKQGSQPLPSSNGSGHGGNSSESLAASLYVPRNDKLVKIDGNLIIHSVLASERAMASRATSEIKSDNAAGSSTNESPQTSLAIAGNLAAAFSVPNDEMHAERHSHVYRSPSVRPKALNAGSRNNYKEAPRSTATDGSLQKWFLEGLAGPILSSGMCTEVFQFDVSPSANPGGIVPATPTVNVSRTTTTNASEPVHPSKRNRRILNHLPIPLAGSEFNHTEEHAGIPPFQNGNFPKNKNLSSMVVSVLVDPREAGDIEVDGGISPKSLSRIFVVVLIDSVKYVTYSCMLPFKGSNSHLVTT